MEAIKGQGEPRPNMTGDKPKRRADAPRNTLDRWYLWVL